MQLDGNPEPTLTISRVELWWDSVRMLIEQISIPLRMRIVDTALSL
jgi:hypothetical protein